MNNKILVNFTNNDITYEEKLDIMIGGLCPAILPMSVLHRDCQIIGYYDISGYKALSQWENLNTQIVFLIIEKIITAIEQCKQYLFFLEDYVINVNTIYVDKECRDVRFIYISDHTHEKPNQKIERLLFQLKDIITPKGKVYLDRLRELISKEGMTTVKMKYIISKLSQEIVCDI